MYFNYKYRWRFCWHLRTCSESAAVSKRERDKLGPSWDKLNSSFVPLQENSTKIILFQPFPFRKDTRYLQWMKNKFTVARLVSHHCYLESVLLLHNINPLSGVFRPWNCWYLLQQFLSSKGVSVLRLINGLSFGNLIICKAWLDRFLLFSVA